MLHKRTLVLIAFILMIGLFTACSGKSTTDQIHEHLEKTVELEEGFDQQQDPIVKLEKEEQDIYKQIVDLSMDEFDEINTLAGDATDIISDRRDILKKEKESIDEAREEFKNIKDLVEDLEDDKVKETAGEMYDVMIDRFEAYDDLHSAYKASLDDEEKLYDMLQNKDLKQEALTEQIKTVNKGYEPVLDANETFNEYTVDYNDKKEAFYKVADIEIEQNDEQE